MWWLDTYIVQVTTTPAHVLRELPLEEVAWDFLHSQFQA